MADIQEKSSSKQNNQPYCYFEIRVRGHLSSEWSDWFESLDIRLLQNGETVLSGLIVDQAAMMGILNKLHRLNLPLVSLNKVGRNIASIEGEQNGKSASIEPQT